MPEDGDETADRRSRWLDRAILRAAPDGPGSGSGPASPDAAVFDLLHFKLADGEDEAVALDGKRIGLFSTRTAAEAAIARVRDAPGFRDWPGGFRILEVVLDRTGWACGFAPGTSGGAGKNVRW